MGIFLVVKEMSDRKYQFWWVLVVLGMLFLGDAVSGFFDPTEAMRNPYNYIELYAETPMPETIQNWIDIFLGLLGILSIVELEFAFSRNKTIRAMRSPIHLLLFILVCVGFLIFALTSIRTLELAPDLAHYYYVRGGQQRHAAALLTELIPIDRDGWFIFGGSGCWCLFFCLENMLKKRLPKLMGFAGIAYALSLLLLLVLQLMDIGKYTGILLLIVMMLLSPFWFIGMGLHLRRRHNEAMQER